MPFVINTWHIICIYLDVSPITFTLNSCGSPLPKKVQEGIMKLFDWQFVLLQERCVRCVPFEFLENIFDVLRLKLSDWLRSIIQLPQLLPIVHFYLGQVARPFFKIHYHSVNVLPVSFIFMAFLLLQQIHSPPKTAKLTQYMVRHNRQYSVQDAILIGFRYILLKVSRPDRLTITFREGDIQICRCLFDKQVLKTPEIPSSIPQFGGRLNRQWGILGRVHYLVCKESDLSAKYWSSYIYLLLFTYVIFSTSCSFLTCLRRSPGRLIQARSETDHAHLVKIALLDNVLSFGLLRPFLARRYVALLR